MTERAQGGPVPPSRYVFGTGDRETFVPSTTSYIVGGYTPSAAVATVTANPPITLTVSAPSVLSQFTIAQLREEIRRR